MILRQRMTRALDGRLRIILVVVATVMGLLVLVAGLVALDFLSARQNLRNLERESPIWTVNHVEIEFLRYEIALVKARSNPGSRLEELRLAFDILYSRIDTLEQGDYFEKVRHLPEYRAALTRLRDFALASAMTIDQPDEVLRAKIDDLVDRTAAAYPTVRRLSLISFDYWNTNTIARREQTQRLFWTLGGTVAAVLCLLAISFVLLYYQNAALASRQRELELARDRAIAGEKAKARFLSVISHEIRNPLNGLLGSMSLLAASPLDRSQTRFMANMQTTGQILLDLLNRVLDISREEAGLTTVRPRPLVLHEFVPSVVESLGDHADAKNIMLECHTEGTWRGPVLADGLLLAKVLENVVGNAIKFTDTGSVDVSLATDLEDDGRVAVRITITDTGRGISADRLDCIFEDFETDENTEVRGSGLGLGITRRIVRAMQGRISVNAAVGVGSTFTIALTLEAATVSTESPAPAPPKRPANLENPSRMKVLIVEDVASNLLVLEILVRTEGHQVTTARNGIEAVEACREAVFDVILMDVEMPVMSGTEAVQRIREDGIQPESTFIVAITAFSLPEDRERFGPAAFDEILIKPIDRDQLRSAFARAADRDERTKGDALPARPLSGHRFSAST
jgi:signal transduction histidine kinase/CheY-like chemotaxis protein